MTDAILLLACLVLAGAVVALAVALRRLAHRLADLEVHGFMTGVPLVEEVAQQPLRDHGSDGLVTGAGAPSSTDGSSDEYVITRLGAEPEEPAPALDSRLFADIVLRESVVKAASFAYGVRRGLSPANRNRIWFEMRREVRRARKERRAEQREAIREWRARQRAAERDGSREDDAA